MTSLLPELLGSLHPDLNVGQRRALNFLAEGQNTFVTGGAGTGKSFLLRKFLGQIDSIKIPVLASTGAAAVLIGGRTFHSFFGLGIMEGGPAATIERALKDKRAVRRLKKMKGFVLDEVSMIPGVALQTAERITSLARGDDRPWGGAQVVAVGDFAQLPPVTRDSRHRDWAFLNEVWARSEFASVHLNEMMRVKDDPEFIITLEDIRKGTVTDRVRALLDWRSVQPTDEDVDASMLFARKMDVDRVNRLKLARLEGEMSVFETVYSGEGRARVAIEANAPIPQRLELKRGALVMMRQNDPQGRWVNGSLGHIQEIEDNGLEVRLLSGKFVDIERARFGMMDAEGNEIATARNFPVTLAYAITIHKAQGATLDRMIVSLKQLWEPGQAYVALSRVRNSEGLMIDGWDPKSIFADPQVTAFHASITG